jgi:hypothetical protein
MSKNRFPEGAFLKWKNDAATREGDQMMTTFSSDPQTIAQAFLSDLKSVKGHFEGAKSLDNPALLEALVEQNDSRSMLVYSLLEEPRAVLVQQKLDVAKSPSGSIMEFRVDVLGGHVSNALFRSGYDYFPEEAQGAQRFVKRFLDKVPERYKYMSGGFDVVMLKNGEYRIIETNPGTMSAMISPDTYPIDANTAFSNLLGRPTPLMQSLEKLYKDGVDAQAAQIRKLRKNVETKASLKDIPQDDLMFWLRDRYMQDFRKNPTRENGQKILSKLRELIAKANKKNDDDFQELYKSAADYVRRRTTH